TSSSAGGGGAAGGAPGLKTYFKTPEGRHKLQYEKTHSPSVLHYNHSSGGKTVSEMTVAYLKEKPVGQGSTPSTPSSSSGMRSAAARLLGTGNGSRTLSFAGSNGVSRAVSGSSRVGGGVGTSTGVGGSQAVANYDGKGTYIIFNTADTLFISDLNSHDKDPVKSIHFSNSNPVCHAFDSEAKDGHDVIVGLWSGDVYSMSLRQQLQDPGKKPVMSQHFINKDKDGTANRITMKDGLTQTAVLVLHGFQSVKAFLLSAMLMGICMCMTNPRMEVLTGHFQL
uniref:Uncharacterized protein n=1 Tax=Aegilops tauschii subsp. strangulata TaxID=200361 RepID=A0A453HHN4_AEGTS